MSLDSTTDLPHSPIIDNLILDIFQDIHALLHQDRAKELKVLGAWRNAADRPHKINPPRNAHAQTCMK